MVRGCAALHTLETDLNFEPVSLGPWSRPVVKASCPAAAPHAPYNGRLWHALGLSSATPGAVAIGYAALHGAGAGATTGSLQTEGALPAGVCGKGSWAGASS